MDDLPPPVGSPRVLVAVEDLERADGLADALAAAGFDPVPAFSVGEAVGAILDGGFDAIVVDASMGEGEPFQGWLKRRFTGVVCLVSDFDGGVGEREGEAVDVVVRLLRGLTWVDG